MDAYTKIDILRCWSDDETDELFELIEDSGYRVVEEGDSKLKPTKELLYNSGGEKLLLLEGKIPYGSYPQLEEWLEKNGIPFKRWAEACDDFPSEMVVFDGVRRSSLITDTTGNAMVDMRALRSIIDMLENDEELRALTYANSHWVETNVENMYRWGMEDVKEIVNDGNHKDDVIDVDVEE